MAQGPSRSWENSSQRQEPGTHCYWELSGVNPEHPTCIIFYSSYWTLWNLWNRYSEPHSVHGPQKSFSQGLRAIKWWYLAWNLGLSQPVSSTTAQVIQMLEVITPDETNAGEESKTQHYLVGLLMMMIQNFNPSKLGLSLHFDRRKKFQVTDLILLFNLLMFKWCPPTMGVGRRTWDQLFPWPLSALYLLFHRLVFSFWFSFCPPSSKKRIKSHTLELI